MANAPAWQRTIARLRGAADKLRASIGPRVLSPPLAPEELGAVEDQLGVPLDEVHRAFLTEVTAGEQDTGTEWLLSPADGLAMLERGSGPSAPFPFAEEDAAALLAESARTKRGQPAPARDGPMDGVLPVIDYGCGLYDCVVLAGPQRGKIWHYGDRGWSVRYTLVEKQPAQLDFLGLVSRHLQDALAELPKLDASATTIDLVALNLRGVPPEVFAATSVERLILSGNSIPTLPEPLFRLTTLRELVVSGTGLTAIPPAIGALRGLRRLSVGANALTALPEEVGRLAELESLEVSHNRLARVPASIVELGQLAKLELASNQLRELPPGLGRLGQLRRLTLEHNPLRELPRDLAGAPVEELAFEGMTELDFAQAFEVLADLASLRTLRVARPCAAVPPSLGELRGLTTLRLIGLGLTSIPPAVLGLDRLETLSLDQNALTTLPDALAELPALRTVVLFSNPIAPDEVARLRARWPHLKIEFFAR